MAAYQAGNEAAFGELFERYAGRVYGFLVRRLGDPSLAEDLYQETFLRLHRARGSYDSRRPFRAWLFGIVHNLLTDTLRDRARTLETTSTDQTPDRGQPGIQPTGADELPSGDISPERLVAAQEISSSIARALAALPPDERTVIILARFEGLSYDDIGDILGRSTAATKQLAYRALKRVRTELRRDSGEED